MILVRWFDRICLQDRAMALDWSTTYFLWFWRKIRVSRLNFLRFWSHAWALFNASAEALACPLAPSPARKTSPRVQTKEQWCPREVFGRTWPSKHRPGYIPKLAPEVVKKWFLTFMILLVTTFTKNVDSWLLKNTACWCNILAQWSLCEPVVADEIESRFHCFSNSQ
jgi:hypothetical protein